MTVFTEPNNLKDFLVWEEDRGKSRKKVIFDEDVVLAQVVGEKKLSCPDTGTAKAGNTGNGTCDSVTSGVNTKIGIYTITCITSAADGGVFAVEDPDGLALPDADVGADYQNKNINFHLTDGSTDFAEGDSFTIEVTAGSGKYVGVDATAVDGTQKAAGISIMSASASEEGVIINGDAIITTSNLVWPDGATEAQKAAWLGHLAEKGIITREES